MLIVFRKNIFSYQFLYLQRLSLFQYKLVYVFRERTIQPWTRRRRVVSSYRLMFLYRKQGDFVLKVFGIDQCPIEFRRYCEYIRTH